MQNLSARSVGGAFVIVVFGILLNGCSHRAVSKPAVVLPTASTPASYVPEPTSSTPVTLAPAQGTASQDLSVSPEVAQNAQNVIEYSDIVIKTIAIVKQAEGTVLAGTFGAPDTHSRLQSAESLMGKASDLYDSKSFSIPGFSDIDSLMRDGMYQDKEGFDYLDFAIGASDTETTQEFKSKAGTAFANAQEDFVKVRQALNDHFDEAKQEVDPQK